MKTPLASSPFRIRQTALLTLLASMHVAVGAAPEAWPGPGGIANRHASPTPVAPDSLRAAWQRTFDQINPVGDQSGPQNEMTFATARGARNLAARDGRLFVLAADGTGFPASFYGTLLNSADGNTLNCVQLHAGLGNTRIYNWPHHAVGMTYDAPTGQPVTWWDPQSGVLFTGHTGYNTAFTAYRPLANFAAYQKGKYQPAVPAYAELQEKHPALADPYGRTRDQFVVRQGVDRARPDLRTASWGPALIYAGDAAATGAKDPRDDLDFRANKQVESLTFYNLSGFITGDPEGPVIAVGKGYGVGHNQSGWSMLFNKHTGFKALGAPLDFPPVAPPAYAKTPPRLAPFLHRGALYLRNRAFFAGPGDDADNNGRFGDERISPNLAKNDQGLHLWAVDLASADLQSNGNYTGPGSAETHTGKLLFRYRFTSRFTADEADLTTRAQSYYEGDGLYRPKAMLVDPDGRTLWFAWKPSRVDAVELIRADAQGAKTYDLGVARGMLGVELWPKLALASGPSPRLVYFTGLGATRKPYLPTDPRPQLLRNQNVGGPAFAKASPADQEKQIAGAKRNGFWSEELTSPSGPAQLAVFDIARGAVAYTDDLSARAAKLGFPANDFFTAFDESHLVVAGRHAYVAWVDTTGNVAQLRLLAYDTAADKPAPKALAFPLGFSGRDFPRSILTDLIAVDGRIHALVTQSKTLHARDPRWTAQHVLTLAPTVAGESSKLNVER